MTRTATAPKRSAVATAATGRMRVMTVLGTRPEIIRLSRIIPLLDEQCDHILVHTGQNYDDRLDGLFFRELGVRAPNVNLGIRAGSAAEQIGQILARIEPLLLEHRPHRFLILGDTNSGLTALVARRLGIPVYHMEAGNRCYDDRVPEEVNRRVIDHCSTVLMPYTNRSRENLLREGFPGPRVYVIGNPIKQVMDHFADRIAASDALAAQKVSPGKYFLATMHRAETVDREDKLRGLIEAFVALAAKYGFPVICSLHPRTAARAQRFGIDLDHAGVRFLSPLGFFDFLKLEQSAFCTLSDSGTVQEEACILRVPNVTIREVTERPETVECGSNLLAGTDPAAIIAAAELATRARPAWAPPAEYLAEGVAESVVRIMLGFRIPDGAEAEWLAGGRGT